jgi:hypothetical protein
LWRIARKALPRALLPKSPAASLLPLGEGAGVSGVSGVAGHETWFREFREFRELGSVVCGTRLGGGFGSSVFRVVEFRELLAGRSKPQLLTGSIEWSKEVSMLKVRRLTLAMVRAALKAETGPLSDEELAERLACSPVTIREHLYRWVQMAAGVRSVRKGPKAFRGWSYCPPEEPSDYEPVTRTVEELEARVAELEAEVAALRRSTT